MAKAADEYLHPALCGITAPPTEAPLDRVQTSKISRLSWLGLRPRQGCNYTVNIVWSFRSLYRFKSIEPVCPHFGNFARTYRFPPGPTPEPVCAADNYPRFCRWKARRYLLTGPATLHGAGISDASCLPCSFSGYSPKGVSGYARRNAPGAAPLWGMKPPGRVRFIQSDSAKKASENKKASRRLDLRDAPSLS